MTSYTAADFCQGHGGARNCTYHPETGDCDHGYDFDHGAISFCDGTCAEGQERYFRYLRTRMNWEPEPVTDSVTLEAWARDMSYRVTFDGPDAQAHALAYMARHEDRGFTEAWDAPISGEAFPALAKVLHPTCHHGLSAELCMDPAGENHFGTRDWEMAMGW